MTPIKIETNWQQAFAKKNIVLRCGDNPPQVTIQTLTALNSLKDLPRGISVLTRSSPPPLPQLKQNQLLACLVTCMFQKYLVACFKPLHVIGLELDYRQQLIMSRCWIVLEFSSDALDKMEISPILRPFSQSAKISTLRC